MRFLYGKLKLVNYKYTKRKEPFILLYISHISRTKFYQMKMNSYFYKIYYETYMAQ